MRDKLMNRVLVLLALLLLAGCGGPEQKKAKFLGKGQQFYDKGDYVKAGLELKNALQIDPKFSQAHYLMGMVEVKRGNLRGGFAAFNKTIELDPGNLKAHYQLGKMFLGAGAADKALEKAELVLKEEPGNAEALLLKGAVQVAKKQNAQAIDFLEGLIARKLTQPDLFLLLAAAHQQQGDLAGAERVLVRGLAANRGAEQINLALAELLMKNGRSGEAVPYLQLACDAQPDNVGLRLRLAALYWDSAQPDRGREVLAQLVARDPKNEETRIAAAGFLDSRGKFEDAQRLLQAGIDANAKSFKLRFALSALYRGAGMNERALALLKECLGLEKDQANPEIIQSKNLLADLQLFSNETEEAGKYIEEVIKESPKNVEAHFNKGLLLLMKKDGAGAVAELRTVVGERPQSVPAYIRLAQAHRLNKEMNLANDCLQTALKIDADSREARRALSRFYLDQKDYPRAEAELRKLLGRNPGDFELRGDLAELFLAMGDQRKAEGVYAELKRSAPNLPLGYLKLSALYLSQGKLAQATAEAEQGTRALPRSAEMLQVLTTLYLAQKKYPQAAALCEARIAQYPKEPLPYTLLGAVYVAQKDYRRALAPYEKALELQPDSANAANNLAFLLSETSGEGEAMDRALKIAQKARVARPDDLTLLDTVGWIHCKKGETREALELFNRVYAKTPDNPELNYHMGMAYFKDGGKVQARSHLQKALAAHQEFPGREVAVATLAKI
jgi:tetratricopeptide (TPR) repeat protein